MRRYEAFQDVLQRGAFVKIGSDSGAFHDGMNLVTKIASNRVAEGILAHHQQGRGINVQRDKVLSAGLQVRESVNVLVVSGTDKILWELPRSNFEKACIIGHFENGFYSFALQHSDTARRATVVMDRAVLAVAPAEN